MAVAKLKYANGAEPTLENPTRGVGWGSAKPVLILKLHNDEIKLLKKRLGDLIGKFEKLIERTGKLEGGQRKITAEMASSFSDVSSNISNFKDQVSKMETFNKSEFAKVKGLITDLKALGLTNMETLSKAITDGDERLDARINEESLSVKEKLEMANNNIELNKRSYNTLDADLVKVASKVTQSEKDIASLNSFVAKHAKTHAEVDAKFKEQGSKLDSVYDEMADFTNDQNAQNQKIAQNLNNHNDLTADFTNHTEDYKTHVKSVETHKADYQQTKQSLQTTQADFKNHMATYTEESADFKEHIDNKRLHKKIWEAPKALHEVMGINNQKVKDAVQKRRTEKGLNFLERLFKRKVK